jgi:hypothetical protein
LSVVQVTCRQLLHGGEPLLGVVEAKVMYPL